MMHWQSRLCLLGGALVLISACGDRNANTDAMTRSPVEGSVRYVAGENHFICLFPSELGYGSITSADEPEAAVEIYSDYAVLSTLIYGSRTSAPSIGEATEAVEWQDSIQPDGDRVWQEFRFSNPSACLILDELPPSNLSPSEPGDNYFAMAYGEIDEAWSCDDFESGRLNASLSNFAVVEDAIRDRMAAKNCDPWRVREETSAMTDEVSVFITTSSNSYIGRFNDFRRASLVLRCSENNSVAFVNFNESLGNDGSYDNSGKNVLVRIGDEAANRQFWRSSTSREAIGLWRGGDSIPFMRRLANAETLRLRVTPDRRNPIEVTFYTNRLQEHLPRLASACGWDFEAVE